MGHQYRFAGVMPTVEVAPKAVLLQAGPPRPSVLYIARTLFPYDVLADASYMKVVSVDFRPVTLLPARVVSIHTPRRLRARF